MPIKKRHNAQPYGSRIGFGRFQSTRRLHPMSTWTVGSPLRIQGARQALVRSSLPAAQRHGA